MVPVRGARKITAQRMHASLSRRAATLTRCQAKALLRYARRLRQVTDATSRPGIGLNDLIMFATARAVAQHPEANSWFDWEESSSSHVNLGFAVDTGHALLVPVIRLADTMTLSNCLKLRAAIDKARAGTLAPERRWMGGASPSQISAARASTGSRRCSIPRNLHPGRRSHTPDSSRRAQSAAAVADL